MMRHKSGNGHNINVEQFMEDLKTVVRDGEELLRAGASGIKSRAIAGAQTTDRAVHSHPYQTLGLAFGLGIIAGLLASGPFGRHFREE
jgi:ElaB/YqjD/DUF883 family membrane-anchored ribosome-binding protein